MQVRARNAIGEGDWSETLKGTPDVQNRDPEFPSSESGARTVAEDLRVGGNVGARVAATDPDGDQLTYSILGGHDLFEIDAATGQLRVQAVLDADEGVTSHTLTVEVSDMLNSSDDEDPAIDDSIVVTVTVTNVNEPPLVDGSQGPSTTPRTRAPPSPNARYSASDPERAAIIWSLGGNDGGKFAISDSGVLSFAAEPDFDIKGDRNGDNIYEVTVRATEEDDGDMQADELTGELDVRVTLSDHPEPPAVAGPASITDYPENSPATRVVGTYTKSDPERQSTSWEELAGADGGHFEIDASGRLRFQSPPDFEARGDAGDADGDNVYEVRVVASDGGLTGHRDVTVTVTNVNEPPLVKRSSGRGAFSIVENSGTEVGSFVGRRTRRGRGVTWSLAMSGDHGRFEIDEFGTLRFTSPPDYESSDLGNDKAYTVTVQATEQDDGEHADARADGPPRRDRRCYRRQRGAHHHWGG